jgi:hypothetical protein
MKALTSLVLVATCALAGCATEPSKSDLGRARAALSESGARVVPFGESGMSLGYMPAVPERAALGAPSFARTPSGETLVLDALKSRVVKVAADGTLSEVAKVDRDAVDLAVADDGAFAVKRGGAPKVVVYGPDGARQGELSFAILQDVERIALLPSRRVVAISAHQERYMLGSPTFPSRDAEILHSKEEGVVSRKDGAGVSLVREADGSLVLVSTAKGAGDERAHEVSRVTFGKGDAARIVGGAGDVVCMRVEHAGAARTGEITVDREAVCADATTGAVTFRAPLGEPGLYVPRRELSFERGALTFVRPETTKSGAGLSITTFAVTEKK